MKASTQDFAIEHFLHDLADPLRQQSGCEIRVTTYLEPSGRVTAEVRGTFMLQAGQALRVDRLAFERARDPEEFLRALVGGQVRPLGEKLRRAAEAASEAWRAAIEEEPHV